MNDNQLCISCEMTRGDGLPGGECEKALPVPGQPARRHPILNDFFMVTCLLLSGDFGKWLKYWLWRALTVLPRPVRQKHGRQTGENVSLHLTVKACIMILLAGPLYKRHTITSQS